MARLCIGIILLVFIGALLFLLPSCTKDIGRNPVASIITLYPENVANIFLNKCATSGCHNSQSMDAAAGLNLETWNGLFAGGRGEAVVIPFRPDYSPLMFYVNSFKEFGTVQLSPKMPLNQPGLNSDEVKILFDWIKAGAPDINGRIKFQEAELKKFYVSNQGCDVVTVFDAATMLAARYIDVGETRGIEAPHAIRVAPDNKHWYVSFIGGGYFMKYRTSDNGLAGKVNLGVGSWNTFVISKDSKRAFVIDFSFPGKIAEVNLVTMTSTIMPGYNYPHGSALGADDEFLYVTAQIGNYIYKLNANNLTEEKKIILDGSSNTSENPSLDPHDIIFTPDHSKYFVTCQGSHEVRVMNTANDSLLKIIPVGEFPQEPSLSKISPYLFVSCMEDTTSTPRQKGSIAVINYQTNTFIKSLYPGFQPHGLAVDDVYKRVYVGNRNISIDGPPPHHQGLCTGRNGYVTAIDLNKLEMIPGFKAEVSIDPYGMGIMH